jgi:hypothetical protein
MRKIFALALLALFGIFNLSAQMLVSTDPMPRNAILEEFTGIHCTYCPDGHAIAQSILDNNPGRAFVIALHQGSFASPSAGEPDYRTSFGDAIAGQTGLPDILPELLTGMFSAGAIPHSTAVPGPAPVIRSCRKFHL